jgi:hypothetical protein
MVDLADLLETKLPSHHDPLLRVAHQKAKELSAQYSAAMRSGSIVTIRSMTSIADL